MLKGYRGLQHSLNQHVIDDALNHIRTLLPFDPALAIKPKEPSEMSIKELKEAIRNAGLSRQAAGFCEKSEFISLLQSHRSNNT